MALGNTTTPELDTNRFLEGMVRCGTVTKVNTTSRVAATVTYPDRGMQTGYLNVLQKNTIGTQEFYCPVPGEAVWVLHLGRNQSRGVILGSCYTKGNPPPYNVQSIRGIVFGDGSFVIYDTATGGSYQINIQGKVVLTTVGDVTATIGGNLSATVSGSATLKASVITLDAPAVKVTGTLWTDFIKPFAASETIANPHVKNLDGTGGGF